MKIKKEQSLENNGFEFNGESFVCPECPKGMKFSLDELQKMSDNTFLSTMKQHEKNHPIKFVPEFDKKEKPVKKESNKEGAKNQGEQPEKKEKKETPSTKKTAPKDVPVQLPAIPKKLLDVGFKQYLLAPKQAFIASGGKPEEFVREINFAIQALMNNDHLLNVAKSAPEHFIEAIKNVALSGLSLSPELKLGYLVPRKGKVYFNSSYMGKTEIITRGGTVKKFYARLVYEGEKFEIQEGTENKIVHVPDPWKKKTLNELKGGYWIAKMANGEILFDTMSKERIEEIRDIYSEGFAVKKGFTPWEKESEAVEMARKSIINWAFKFLPKTGLSRQQIEALEVTGEYDREVMNDHNKKPEKRKADEFAEDGPAGNGRISDAQVIE